MWYFLLRPECFYIASLYEKILLVDDDTDLLLLFRHALKAKGYQVTTPEEASGVITAIDGVHPDLVILDINIGKHDGREICREVKQNHSYDYIPVVLFSALVKEKDALEGCEVDAYKKNLFQSLFLFTKNWVLISRPIKPLTQKNPAQRAGCDGCLLQKTDKASHKNDCSYLHAKCLFIYAKC